MHCDNLKYPWRAFTQAEAHFIWSKLGRRQENNFILFYFCWRWTLDQLSRAEAIEQLNLQKGKTQRRWLHPAWLPGHPSPLWQMEWRKEAAEYQDAVVWGILTCTRRFADWSVVRAPIRGHWGIPLALLFLLGILVLWAAEPRSCACMGDRNAAAQPGAAWADQMHWKCIYVFMNKDIHLCYSKDMVLACSSSSCSVCV